VAEWLKAAVLKIATPCKLRRGFKSYPLRQISRLDPQWTTHRIHHGTTALSFEVRPEHCRLRRTSAQRRLGRRGASAPRLGGGGSRAGGVEVVPAHSFAQGGQEPEGLAALVAGGGAVLLASTGRVPTIAQGLSPGQSIATPAEQQTHLVLTMATAVTGALVIFVTAFLFGLWCGWMWRRRRR
jgi:hypothetical protein